MKKGCRRVSFVSIVLGLLFFIFPVWAELKVANDPTRLGVGARPLGMGKAFVAVDNDPGVMFINPAGTGSTSQLQITSMSGNFLSEVNYSQFGAIYPTTFGNFGIGYIGSGIGYTAPVSATAEVDGEVRVIPSTTEGSASYNYGNTAILLTYGLSLSQIFTGNFLENVALGTNFKIFSQSLAGGTITGGTGSGCDLDLGMLYKPGENFSLGLNLQNILPESLGGKLVWPAGGSRTGAVEESFPANAKLGMALKLAGGTAFIKTSQQLFWTLDIDRSLELASMPTLLHTGIEWWPTTLAALRFGIDQDVVGSDGSANDASSNLTAGVGLCFGDFRFDYAYHQYSSVSDNDTHYFSLSYGVKPKEIEVKESFVLNNPTDGAITYEGAVEIEGQVVGVGVSRIEVNGQTVGVDEQQNFKIELPVVIGKNTYTAAAYNRGGTKLSEAALHVIRLLTYKDLSETYWAKLPIEYLATLSVVAGYPDGTFKPNEGLSRAELATLLVKAKGIQVSSPAGAVFKDVPAGHWAAKYVKAAVDEGLVTGYPDGSFKPQSKISRVEGIIVMARFAQLKEVESVSAPPFPDLSTRHWAAKYIEAAKQAGLLKFLYGRGLSPTLNLTRGEAAEILSKTPFAKNKISELVGAEHLEK